jgi:selenocysteine-specific elongation factor
MQVVATAGHVDHGKSRLVRALTGMEPDRWSEEQRRGMTIDLGFAWTTLPSGVELAFVDVPGHERFVTNMLAGVGPVPAVMLVVAADEGWKPQTQEHVDALDALGVRHGLVVVTKTDLADPGAVLADVRRRLAATSLAGVGAVAVSAATGSGLADLTAALGALAQRLPAPPADAPVRLWVDRSFTIRGAGTVVTGTLAAGTVRVADQVEIAPGGDLATIRGLESLKREVDDVAGVARVAVNLRGVERERLQRGDVLLTPAAWEWTDSVDAVWTQQDADLSLPAAAVAHIGSAAVAVRIRVLGGAAVRLQLAAPLPLHVGDRMLLRDPGARRVLGAADVADLRPPALRRRGDAARVAAGLRLPVTADDMVRRHGQVRADRLFRAGLAAPDTAVEVAGWFADSARWSDAGRRLRELVEAAGATGIDIDRMGQELALPEAELVRALIRSTSGVEVADGRVRPTGATAPLDARVAELADRLAADPLGAPDAAEVAAIGRGPLHEGVRRGLLLRLADGVYVGPKAVAVAIDRLAGLPEPFTVGDARTALGSSRRVVVPLLEHLDAQRHTRKQSDGTRCVVRRQGSSDDRDSLGP